MTADWNWDKPSRAVCANNGGTGVLLWSVGGHIAVEVDAAGVFLDDLGLDGAPDGVSVWEGTYEPTGVYEDRVFLHAKSPPVPMSDEQMPCGDFRKPTDDEWAAIHAGRNPWDEEQWMKRS